MKICEKFLFQKMSSLDQNMGRTPKFVRRNISKKHEEIKRQKFTSNQKNTNKK